MVPEMPMPLKVTSLKSKASGSSSLSMLPKPFESFMTNTGNLNSFKCVYGFLPLALLSPFFTYDKPCDSQKDFSLQNQYVWLSMLHVSSSWLYCCIQQVFQDLPWSLFTFLMHYVDSLFNFSFSSYEVGLSEKGGAHSWEPSHWSLHLFVCW